MKASDLQGWGGELLELAWELNDLGFDSVVRLSPGRRPSVEIFVPPGRSRVATAQRGRTSVFTWKRQDQDSQGRTRQGQGRQNPNRQGGNRRGRDQRDRERQDRGQQGRNQQASDRQGGGRQSLDRQGENQQAPNWQGGNRQDRDWRGRSRMREAAERLVEVAR
ncbi:hypothetical protein [Streptosporangium sp. NPDC049644]|uniref:hypothetical protein n=1 Tax=Streptosporangium sp. NPDC049644 TaxID=3155507 RepID=UPI003449A4FB